MAKTGTLLNMETNVMILLPVYLAQWIESTFSHCFEQSCCSVYFVNKYSEILLVKDNIIMIIF